MVSNTEYDYGTLRLKQSTIDFLKDMKLAFEASYQKKFTMSEFLEQMTSSVETEIPEYGRFTAHSRLKRTS